MPCKMQEVDVLLVEKHVNARLHPLVNSIFICTVIKVLKNSNSTFFPLYQCFIDKEFREAEFKITYNYISCRAIMSDFGVISNYI